MTAKQCALTRWSRSALADFSVAVSIVVLLTALTFAHGGKKHDEAQNDTTLTETVISDSAAANLDSVYTAIAVGFEKLKPVFVKGCFDCHSDYTKHPWYYKLPLVKGMIDADIRGAKKHLDMTNGFPFKSHGTPAGDLKAIKDILMEHEMPPWNYRLLHWDAKPSGVERDSVFAWLDRSLALLSAHGQIPAIDTEQ